MWRYARFHSSVILAWLALGILVGILLVLWWPVRLPMVWLLPVLVVAIAIFRSRRWYAVVLAIVCGVMIGIIRSGDFAADVHQLSELVNSRQTIVATISQDPTNDDLPSVWKTQLGRVEIGGRRYTGEIYATILSEDALQRGDKVQISGTLREGFGSFALTLRRATLDNRWPSQDVFLQFRNSFAASVKRVVPEPEAALGLGFLVGQKSALDQDFEDQLRLVGLTHIVVASGYNLTVLVRFARRLLAKRSRYLAMSSSLGMVALFVAISGMSPSMNRAAVVTFLSLVAWYYGRTFHPVKLILLVAAGSALAYPTYLWSDLGWMLSFAAFFGVLVVSPLVMDTINSRKKKPADPGEQPVLRLLVETTSAQLMTLPLIAVAFGTVSVVSLLANLLVAPVVPFAMALTALAGVVGGLGVLSWLAVPASVVLAYVVSIVQGLASLPWASVQAQLPFAVAVACYIAICVWIGTLWAKRRRALESASIVI